jgi:hypothetical protein
MKHAFKHFSKITLSVILLSSAVVLMYACKKDKDKNTDVYTLTANASGANEFPNPNASTATGTLTGTYNKTTKKLTYTIAWTGLAATSSALHFHGPALPGASASPAVTLTITTPGTTGGATGEITLTEAQEADMLAGKWYWNVHNSTFIGGEIRGQVSATL